MENFMKVFSKDGLELLLVKDIYQEGDVIFAKGKVMNSMPVTIAIKPEDCWELVRLMGIRMILGLPVMLVKGLFRVRKARTAAAQ